MTPSHSDPKKLEIIAAPGRILITNSQGETIEVTLKEADWLNRQIGYMLLIAKALSIPDKAKEHAKKK